MTISLRAASFALAVGALGCTLVVTEPEAVPDFEVVRTAPTSEGRLLDRHGRLLDERRTDNKVRRLEWTPLNQVSPELIETVIHAEDRRFAEHGGIDWRAVLGATRDRLTKRRSARGASTLTMQLAGLLRIDGKASGRRSLLGKLRQMRAAAAIERRWSKPQILEAYLNLAPYRGELVGIGAAADLLVGKAPSGLDAAESAVLAALLPAPSAPTWRVADRACRLAAAKPRALGCDRVRVAAANMLEGGRRLPPASRLAPHLAGWLLRPGVTEVRTTIDLDVQTAVASVLSRRLAGLSPRNARDGAAIVVDNATGDILAYVGSAGPASTAPEVDGVRAPRQAGSTLKPFLYGLALDRRYLTAASILDDTPVDLDTASGLYIPQNYDRIFRGPVSVRTALGNSLNVPAVRALLVVGTGPFRDLLFDAGYRSISQDGDHYGYSLALGSAEVTLFEQAAAYRTLARGGVFGSLRLATADPHEATRRVLSAPAAAIVADILADKNARSATFGLDNGLALPFWAAVKTGTSKAMRDNWCIGFSDRFTVAVWVGNFEGDSMVGVSGVTGAAPAWREIMLWLHRDRRGRRPGLPAGVAETTVRFDPAVEPTRSELFLAGTQLSVVRAAPIRARRPRIVEPASGTIIALDPDIPLTHQRVAVRTEAALGSRLSVDGVFLAEIANGTSLWQPIPGSHLIEIIGPNGHRHDAVRVTVR